jgi:hypothetical protein
VAEPAAEAALLTEAQQLIVGMCDELKEFLLAKNRAYGNSALEPLNVFAKHLSPADGITLRIDDKLKRLKFGHAAGEDVEWDLLGYLILLRIARRKEAQDVSTPAEPPVLRSVVERSG